MKCFAVVTHLLQMRNAGWPADKVLSGTRAQLRAGPCLSRENAAKRQERKTHGNRKTSVGDCGATYRRGIHIRSNGSKKQRSVAWAVGLCRVCFMVRFS